LAKAAAQTFAPGAKHHRAATAYELDCKKICLNRIAKALENLMALGKSWKK